jgi:hypothetical protein
MRRIIGIEFGRAQSVSMDEIHLAADIDFGAIDIKIGDDSYTLSLASVLVLLEKTNANIVTGSKYSHALAEGEIVTNATETQSSASGGGVEAGAGADDTTRFGGKLKAWINRSGNKALEASTNIKHRINLVTPEGQDGWRIGGPNGNPLLATKDLRGAVIDSRNGDNAKPLCTLEAVDPDMSVSGRIRVQATLDDFRLRGKARENAALDGVSVGLQKDQLKLVSREKATEQELRERVAVMSLLLPKRREADEILLDIAVRSFTFLPEAITDEGK